MMTWKTVFMFTTTLWGRYPTLILQTREAKHRGAKQLAQSHRVHVLFSTCNSPIFRQVTATHPCVNLSKHTAVEKGFFDVPRQGPKLLFHSTAVCSLLQHCVHSWLFKYLSSPPGCTGPEDILSCPPPQGISKAERNALPLGGSQSDRETASN